MENANFDQHFSAYGLIAGPLWGLALFLRAFSRVLSRDEILSGVKPADPSYVYISLCRGDRDDWSRAGSWARRVTTESYRV